MKECCETFKKCSDMTHMNASFCPECGTSLRECCVDEARGKDSTAIYKDGKWTKPQKKVEKLPQEWINMVEDELVGDRLVKESAIKINEIIEVINKEV